MKNTFIVKAIALLSVILFPSTLFSQNIIPDVSARVDTSDIEINKVYQLFKGYLNSRPDSSSVNPFWNADECPA